MRGVDRKELFFLFRNKIELVRITSDF